jgi:tetratricopeptide (TPR) repeat protein
MASHQVQSISELLNEAVAAHRLGEIVRASCLYEEVLRVDSHQADALHMLGLIAQQAGDLGRARALIEASIAGRPDVSGAHYNLAIVRALQDDVVGAIAAYEAAVRLAPDFADAHSNLGNLYLQSGCRERALGAYMAAIRAKPDFAPVYCNLATVLISLEQFDDAILALEAALRLTPNMPEAYANLGQAYRRSGRFREAMVAARLAIELRPNYRDAYLNLAIAAYAIDEFDVALDAYLRILELGGTSPEMHGSIASVYHALGRYGEAIAHSEAAVGLRPLHAEAHTNLAVSHLVRGEFSPGWDEYVWMWRLPAKRASYPYLDGSTPLWNGEPFPGRQLIITRDQGFGDAIQMVRYLPAVKARGGRVVLEVAVPLVPLFADLPGVDEVRIHHDVASVADDVDLHVPLSGLPRAFGTKIDSIPAPIPYLRAPAERVERWRARLDRPADLRVGIAWGGNADHANDRNRSSRLEDFAPLGALEGVAWFGLQKGRDENRRSCGSLLFDPLGADIIDFADTAAILTQLDLVISVDTSIVHLAGALGTRVWTLLAFVPDWRWMLERSDSPWYPTMRFFRQPRAGDWASVFADVARELGLLLTKLTDSRAVGTTSTHPDRTEP